MEKRRERRELTGEKRDKMSFTIPPVYFMSVQLNYMLNMHSPVVHIAVVGWWHCQSGTAAP